MRVPQLVVIAFLTATAVIAKKSPRRGSASRAFGTSRRNPKPAFVDWDSVDGESSEDDYFSQDFRMERSPRYSAERDDDDFDKYKKRPPTKRKPRSKEDDAATLSEGTFSGAGKGPLYDAYNQLHTLAQVCVWSHEIFMI